MEEGKPDFKLNLYVIGDSGAGKTALVECFVDGVFSESSPTSAVDYKTKTVDVDGKTAQLQVHDSMANDRFRTVGGSPYSGFHGIVIVFDVTDQASFNNVKQWLQEVERYARDNIPKIIVGTKTDLASDHKVDSLTAQEFAEHLGIPYVEASSQNGTNVDEVFTTLTRGVIRELFPAPEVNLNARVELRPVEPQTIQQSEKKSETSAVVTLSGEKQEIAGYSEDEIRQKLNEIEANAELSEIEKLEKMNALFGTYFSAHPDTSKKLIDEYTQKVSVQTEALTQKLLQSAQTLLSEFVEVDDAAIKDFLEKGDASTQAYQVFINKLTKYTNSLSVAIQSSILKAGDQNAAVFSYRQWLLIALKCYQQKDYFTAQFIFTALSTAAVSRLEVLLSEKDLAVMNELKQVFDPKGNFKNYKALMLEQDQTGSSYVPMFMAFVSWIGAIQAQGVAGLDKRSIDFEIEKNRNLSIALNYVRPVRKMAENLAVVPAILSVEAKETEAELSELSLAVLSRKDKDTLLRRLEETPREKVGVVSFGIGKSAEQLESDLNAIQEGFETEEKSRGRNISTTAKIREYGDAKEFGEAKLLLEALIEFRDATRYKAKVAVLPKVRDEAAQKLHEALVRAKKEVAQLTDVKEEITKMYGKVNELVTEGKISINFAQKLLAAETEAGFDAIYIEKLKEDARLHEGFVGAMKFLEENKKSFDPALPWKDQIGEKNAAILEEFIKQKNITKEQAEAILRLPKDEANKALDVLFASRIDSEVNKQMKECWAHVHVLSKRANELEELKKQIDYVESSVKKRAERLGIKADEILKITPEEVSSFVLPGEKLEEIRVVAAPGLFANVRQRIEKAGGLFNFVRALVVGKPETTPEKKIEEAKPEPEPEKANDVEMVEVLPSSRIEEPYVSAPVTSAAHAVAPVAERKLTLIENVTWENYWKVFKELAQKERKEISEKSGERGEKGKEEVLLDRVKLHREVGNQLKIKIVINDEELKEIADMNDNDFEDIVNQLVAKRKVQGPTTVETKQQNAAHRELAELAHINNTFYNAFIEVESQMDAFVNANPSDTLLQEFGNQYRLVVAFFKEIQAIDESNPLKKSEVIAQRLLGDNGKIAQDIIRFTELKTQVSAKYPEQFTGNTEEAREFDNAVIVPSQWVTKAVIVLEAVIKAGVAEATRASALFKEVASIANKTESVTSTMQSMDLQKLSVGKGPSKLPSAGLNDQAQEVQALLTPQFANLGSRDKNKAFDKIYGLMKSYLEKVAGKGNQELSEKDVENIKKILANVSELLAFVKIQDPAFGARKNEIELGKAIAGLPLGKHKDLAEECNKLMLQFSEISIDKDAVGLPRKPVINHPLMNSAPLPQAKTTFVQADARFVSAPLPQPASRLGEKGLKLLVDQPVILEKILLEKGPDADVKRQEIKESRILEKMSNKHLWQAYLLILLEPGKTSQIIAQNLEQFNDDAKITGRVVNLINTDNPQILLGIRIKLVDENTDQDAKRRVKNLLQQKIEEEVDAILGEANPAEKLAERMKYPEFLANLQWHPSQLSRVLQIENIPQNDRALLKKLESDAAQDASQPEKVVWERRDVEAALKEITNKDLRGALLDNMSIGTFGGNTEKTAEQEAAFKALIAEINETTEKFGGAMPSYAVYQQIIAKFIERNPGIAFVGQWLNIDEGNYKFTSNEMSGQWRKEDFIYALNNIKFTDKTNKRLCAYLVNRIERLREEDLPALTTPEQANALQRFINDHLANFTGEASLENYDAMVHNARGVREIAEKLFKLTKDEFYLAVGKNAPQKVAHAPSAETINSEGDIKPEQENMINEIERIENGELKALILMNANGARKGLADEDHSAFRRVVDQLNYKFGENFPSYEQYQNFLTDQGINLKEGELLYINEELYREYTNIVNTEMGLGNLESVMEAQSLLTAFIRGEEREEAAPRRRMAFLTDLAERIKRRVDAVRDRVAERREEKAARKGLFGLDAPLADLEKLVKGKEQLNARDLAKVNQLLEAILNETTIERENRKEPLYYPVDAMERIVTLLAKHYQMPGLNVMAIQGMFPPVEAVNKYLKQEEAKLDAMIDALDPEDFEEIFDEYFHPDDPSYKDFYAVMDKAKGLAAGTSEAATKAYSFKDILKKSFAIGSQESGGQAGIVRDQAACDAAEAFLHATESSEDESVQFIRALIQARSQLSMVDRFGAARNALRAEAIAPDTVEFAIIGLKTPEQMREGYETELQKLLPASNQYLASLGIQNAALDLALAKVISEKYFGEDVTDTDELSDNFIARANLLVNKDAKMPDVFLANWDKFHQLIEGEIKSRQSQLDARQALIIAVVKGDIDYELNPKGFEAIDANLMNVKRYQAELTNAIKVIQRKFGGRALKELEALEQEKALVDKHIDQLSMKLNQIRRGHVGVEKPIAPLLQEEAVAEASMLRELDDVERKTETTQKWVAPKLRKKPEETSHASSNERILEGLDNPILKEAMVVELDHKNIDLANGVELSVVQQAVKDINALIPDGEEVMPVLLLNKYANFLKIVKDIPGINAIRAEFIVAVVSKGISPEIEMFANEMKEVNKLLYSELGILADNVQQKKQVAEELIGNFKDAIKYLEEAQIAGVDVEVKRLKQEYKKMEQIQKVLQGHLDVIGRRQAKLKVGVATIEVETVKVGVVSLKITMTREEETVSLTPAEKGKLLAVIKYNLKDVNKFKAISGNETLMKKALDSDSHVIVVRNDGISYNQPKDSDALSETQMKELVARMVKEACDKFNPKDADDIKYEGSQELQEMARKMMAVEIKERKALADKGPAKGKEPESPRVSHSPRDHK